MPIRMGEWVQLKRLTVPSIDTGSVETESIVNAGKSVKLYSHFKQYVGFLIVKHISALWSDHNCSRYLFKKSENITIQIPIHKCLYIGLSTDQ